MPLDKVEKYDLWRPVVRPERREALERLHQSVGISWSHGLLHDLGRSVAISFEGSSFEPFSRLCDSEKGSCEITAFVLEHAQASGLLVISRGLMRDLIDARLGEKARPAEPAKEEAQSFTPLETALAAELAASLLSHVNQVYVPSGLGELKAVRHTNQFRDLPGLEPEDYLILFRYQVEGQEIAGSLMVALSTAVINAVVDPAASRKSGGQRKELTSQIARLPVEVEVLLGSWEVPIGRLTELRPGDAFALPGAEEAVLMTGGKRLQSLKVEFEPQLIRLQAQRRFKYRGKD